MRSAISPGLIPYCLIRSIWIGRKPYVSPLSIFILAKISIIFCLALSCSESIRIMLGVSEGFLCFVSVTTLYVTTGLTSLVTEKLSTTFSDSPNTGLLTLKSFNLEAAPLPPLVAASLFSWSITADDAIPSLLYINDKTVIAVLSFNLENFCFFLLNI